jgi:methylamine dehydrogenase heavy chain
MKKLIVVLALFSTTALAEIAPEQIGAINSLPDTYPPHWIIAQDGAFFHMSDGKFIVLDVDSDDPIRGFKGMFNGSFIAQFYQAKTKPLMYVAETFHSRGNRGERTDVLTIYSKTSLAPIGEVVLPPKRMSGMPTLYHLQLVDDEKIALIFNFTPAASVSVVDVVAMEFLGEVQIPGCALVYPMGGRAFASLCSDGSMLSVQLDEEGRQATSSRTEAFFDTGENAMMEKAALHDGVAYFPTFEGYVQPVDLNGKTPVVGKPWSMVGDEEGGWRPGGLQFTGTDSGGRLYVLMHPDGEDGTHKNPGVETWIFDTGAGQRTRRIALKTPAISIGLTRDESPLLVATNINLEIDVYDASEGTHLRTLGNFGQETPFILHGAH